MLVLCGVLFSSLLSALIHSCPLDTNDASQVAYFDIDIFTLDLSKVSEPWIKLSTG